MKYEILSNQLDKSVEFSLLAGMISLSQGEAGKHLRKHNCLQLTVFSHKIYYLITPLTSHISRTTCDFSKDRNQNRRTNTCIFAYSHGNGTPSGQGM